MTRMFSSYTTAELIEAAKDPRISRDLLDRYRAEITARDAGASKPRITPQIAPLGTRASR